MAEFQAVMHEIGRICKKTCHEFICSKCILGDDCLLSEFPANRTKESLERMERAALKWAKKHPDVRYPTWEEWQHNTFPGTTVIVPPCAFRRIEGPCMMTCGECRSQPIPADIAKKLGVEPIKEDK